jgi:hypothetical protein
MDTGCRAVPDPRGQIFPNSLSPLAAADLLRRIVMIREIPEVSQFPEMQFADAQTVLYGAEDSVFFPGLTWGGMSTDTAIFLQSAVDMARVEKESRGRWRIFSKLGGGYSTSRFVGEIVTNAYACFPVLDESGNPVPDEGVEFFISCRGSVPKDIHLEAVDKAVHQSVVNIVKQIYDHAF